MNFDLTIIGAGEERQEAENIQYLNCDFQGGLAQAQGEYIVFLNFSDENLPRRWSRQLEALRTTDALVCFCGASVRDGEDFDPIGLSGVIPPATVAVSNLCLSAAMFKTEHLRTAVNGEKIDRNNPYFWLRVLRSIECISFQEKLLTVSVNDERSFRDIYGNKEQSGHHPLVKYYYMYDEVKNSGIYKMATIPKKLARLFGGR